MFYSPLSSKHSTVNSFFSVTLWDTFHTPVVNDGTLPNAWFPLIPLDAAPQANQLTAHQIPGMKTLNDSLTLSNEL